MDKDTLLETCTQLLQDTLEAIREGSFDCPDKDWLKDLEDTLKLLNLHWSNEDMKVNG